jgi:hypothetical protein
MSRRQFDPTRSEQDCVVRSDRNRNVMILPGLTRTRVLLMAIASVAMSSNNYGNPWEDQVGETRSEPEWTDLRKLISTRKIIRELPTGHVYPRVLYSVETLCQFCNTKLNQHRGCLDWSDACALPDAACAVGRYDNTWLSMLLSVFSPIKTLDQHTRASRFHILGISTLALRLRTHSSCLYVFCWCRCYRSKLFLCLQLYVRVLPFKTFLTEGNSNTTKRLCTNYL